jgi:hypothetical protein
MGTEGFDYGRWESIPNNSWNYKSWATAKRKQQLQWRWPQKRYNKNSGKQQQWYWLPKTEPPKLDKKRTFLEVILGVKEEDGRAPKVKTQAAKIEVLESLLMVVGDDPALAHYKSYIERDRDAARKAHGSPKSKSAALAAKAAYVSREAKRLEELEVDIRKASDALASRKAALELDKDELKRMHDEADMEVDSDILIEGLEAAPPTPAPPTLVRSTPAAESGDAFGDAFAARYLSLYGGPPPVFSLQSPR